MSNDSRSERDRIRAEKQAALERKVAQESESDSANASPREPITILDSGHLESVLEDHPVTLVDCYADWCGPCKMMDPTIEGLAAETAATIAKIDVDAHPGLAQQLGVRGVPTLVLYVDGQIVERLVGVQDRGTLEQLIDQYL